MKGRTNNAVNGNSIEIQPFSYYGSHLNELSSVLDLHYNGTIDLSELWSIGDVMTNIPISEITSTTAYTPSTVPAQNIDLVLIGTNHDILYSDSSKRAAITVTTTEPVGESWLGPSPDSWSSTYNTYSNLPLKGWLNTNFYDALPTTLKSLVKSVRKYWNYPTSDYASDGLFQSTTQNYTLSSEKCWFAGDWEFFGSEAIGRTYRADGEQYPYYKPTINRVRPLTSNSNIVQISTRSGQQRSNSNFYQSLNASNGSMSTVSISYYNEESSKTLIYPHFCL